MPLTNHNMSHYNTIMNKVNTNLQILFAKRNATLHPSTSLIVYGFAGCAFACIASVLIICRLQGIATLQKYACFYVLFFSPNKCHKNTYGVFTGFAGYL